MASVQDIFTWDPKTGKITKAWGVRRSDTVKKIEARAGAEEAAEFAAVVKRDPNRRQPWQSKSGKATVFFNESGEDSW